MAAPRALAVSGTGLLFFALAIIFPERASASGAYSLSGRGDRMHELHDKLKSRPDHHDHHGHHSHHSHHQHHRHTVIKDPDFVRVESARGEAMAGMLLSWWGLKDKEAKLQHAIETLKREALKDIEASALQATEDLRLATLRFEAARSTISGALGKLSDSVDIRHGRVAVASFHSRLGKCCCTQDTKSCQWEAFDRGGANLDYECSGEWQDYLDVLLPEGEDMLEGGITVKSRKVDMLLDKCYASSTWVNRLQAGPAAQADPRRQIEVLEENISQAVKQRDAATVLVKTSSQQVTTMEVEITTLRQRAKQARADAAEAKATLARLIAEAEARNQKLKAIAAQSEANNAEVRKLAAQRVASAEQMQAEAEAKDKELERQRKEFEHQKELHGTQAEQIKKLEQRALEKERAAQETEQKAAELVSEAKRAQKAAESKAGEPCEEHPNGSSQGRTHIVVVAPVVQVPSEEMAERISVPEPPSIEQYRLAPSSAEQPLDAPGGPGPGSDEPLLDELAPSSPNQPPPHQPSSPGQPPHAPGGPGPGSDGPDLDDPDLDDPALFIHQQPPHQPSSPGQPPHAPGGPGPGSDEPLLDEPAPSSPNQPPPHQPSSPGQPPHAPGGPGPGSDGPDLDDPAPSSSHVPPHQPSSPGQPPHAPGGPGPGLDGLVLDEPAPSSPHQQPPHQPSSPGQHQPSAAQHSPDAPGPAAAGGPDAKDVGTQTEPHPCLEDTNPKDVILSEAAEATQNDEEEKLAAAADKASAAAADETEVSHEDPHGKEHYEAKLLGGQ